MVKICELGRTFQTRETCLSTAIEVEVELVKGVGELDMTEEGIENK